MTVIEEGAKKSGVLWLTLDRPRLAWHTLHEGAVYLVTGGGEQELPGLAERSEVHVTLRSKDNGARLVEFDAPVTVIDPSTEPEAVAALAKDRLNAPDTEHLTDRWARDSTIIRITLPAT
ncbi:hypothetical protein ACIBKY_23440 [Nonomuraea sp. NPDC050394]|uniref:hypothetical protein n=1 Tax=Nonomuraea sp. NPDC050394 TaxID=3364363 RepID=UPI0037B761A7